MKKIDEPLHNFNPIMVANADTELLRITDVSKFIRHKSVAWTFFNLLLYHSEGQTLERFDNLVLDR